MHIELKYFNPNSGKISHYFSLLLNLNLLRIILITQKIAAVLFLFGV